MREFLRGAVRLHVLHHAANHEINGAWMTQELARHGYKISPGSLYPILHKMEADGLIRSHAELKQGRVQRSYIATSKGRTELTRTKKQLKELADEVLGDETR